MEPARFGLAGKVWSSVTIHVPVGDRTPPYALAYVDLDDGPRLLVDTAGGEALPCDSRVTIEAFGEGEVLDLVAVPDAGGER